MKCLILIITTTVILSCNKTTKQNNISPGLVSIPLMVISISENFSDTIWHRSLADHYYYWYNDEIDIQNRHPIHTTIHIPFARQTYGINSADRQSMYDLPLTIERALNIELAANDPSYTHCKVTNNICIITTQHPHRYINWKKIKIITLFN